jgi:hypothetical protein
MRTLQIEIRSRQLKGGTSTGDYTVNGYMGNTDKSVFVCERGLVDSPYRLISAVFMHSIVQSDLLSKVSFIMTKPNSKEYSFQGGQPVRVWDAGLIIFDGVIVKPMYFTKNNMQYCDLILGTYAYQLTKMPLFFTTAQLQQLNEILGINLDSSLAGKVAVSIPLASLTDAIIDNTDYEAYGKNEIIFDGDYEQEIYLMATTGQSRDAVIRQSIDFLNEVFYQQESGEWRIDTLDANNLAPFSIDVTNASATSMTEYDLAPVNGAIPDNGFIPATLETPKAVPSLIDVVFIDNTYTTPVCATNYGFVEPDVANAAKATSFIVAVTPDLNKPEFKRMNQLVNSSWFIGSYESSQIDDNIVNDPTMAAVFNQGYIVNNPYFKYASNGVDSKGNNVKVSDSFTAYQLLLAYKTMAKFLSSYYQLIATFLLDDPVFSRGKIPLGNLLGTVVPINNCIMEQGIIATTARSYNEDGRATFSINLAPLGSLTGKWITN